jgi:hypothetical protein
LTGEYFSGPSLSILRREPRNAAACEPVGEERDEVEDPSLGEQTLRDVVEAGAYARARPIGELVRSRSFIPFSALSVCALVMT